MRWYDPLPVMAALAVFSTAWLIYAFRYQRREVGGLQLLLLQVSFGTSLGSLFGFAIQAAAS